MTAQPIHTSPFLTTLPIKTPDISNDSLESSEVLSPEKNSVSSEMVSQTSESVNRPLVFAYGTVLGKIYQKPGSRWAIAKVRFHKTIQWVKGEILPLENGLLYQFGGWWEHDEQWGQGFRVRFRREVIPSDTQELFRYLVALRLPHLSPAHCRQIVERWGLQCLQIMEERSEILQEVGLREDQCKQIGRYWRQKLPSRSLLVSPESWGLTHSQAENLFAVYGGKTLSLLREDPYSLLQQAGLGFSTADQIAERVGISRQDPRRTRAALRSILSQAAYQEGHTALPRQELLARTRSRQMQLTGDGGEVALHQLLEEQSLHYVPGTELIGLQFLVEAEIAIAEQIQSCLSIRTERSVHSAPSDLLPQQAEAVRVAQTHPLMVLTGSPGTGKTFTLRAILQAGWEKPMLAAPTGKAAHRLSELTGLPAYTLHRLLEYRPGQDTLWMPEKKLDTDLLVVDEAAMIDVPLAYALFQSVDLNKTTLILSGDADQLPPVGPGHFLRDLLQSQQCPVVRLTQIVRQDASSQIIPNAQRVLMGEPILVNNHKYTDFKYFSVDASTQLCEQEDLKRSILEVFDQLQHLGYSSRDIQVLTPMKKGGIPGTQALNPLLQQKLNPAPCLSSSAQDTPGFRVGDRVVQLRNDHDRGVFNGDTGIVTQIHGPHIQVLFEDRAVVYDDHNVSQLELAYAISIHKSQGSEWPVVILPLSLSHKPMLTRRLLYTAITRTKKLFVLIGSAKAVGYALAQQDDNDRITTLPYWLTSNTQDLFTSQLPSESESWE